MNRSAITRRLLLAAVFVAAAPAGAASYVNTVLADGPVAYFRLTSPGAASLTGGYTTTWQNSVTTGPGAPLAADPGNTGALFDGVNNATPGIVTTSLSGNVPGKGTIVAWVNLAQLPSVKRAFEYIAGESQGGNDLDLQFTDDNVLRFYTGGGENTAFAPDTATLAGNWHMIVATYDATLGASSFRNIYFDGVLGTGFTGGVNGAAKSAPFTIGYSSVFGGREFGGGIDEVALFDRSLSAGEVASLYASRLDPGGVAGVPEPATWATMLGGFGLLGAAMRRRRPLTAAIRA